MKSINISTNSNFNGRFYLLDLARAVAAICVVLQHYQHFYFIAPHVYQDNFVRSQQPLYETIKPFYLFGPVAVQFFFVLSGFIFFFMYKDMIFSKSISFKNFIILRLSRLYPLHLLTLFIMLFLQLYYNYLNDSYFIYEENNLKNFLLHILLIQEWGLVASQWAFNAASWSISVEFLLYIVFFYVALIGIKNLFQSILSLIIAFILFVIIQPEATNLMVGFVCFYIGGVTYFFYIHLKKIINIDKTTKILTLFFLIILNVIIFGRFLNSYFLTLQNNLEFLIGDRFLLLLYFVKFPLIILTLALMQNFFNNLGKSLKLLGDMSYTIYLVHVPVEIIYSIIDTQIIKINYDSNYFFLIYFVTIFLFSFVIFAFFEIPLKKFIRKKLIKKII